MMNKNIKGYLTDFINFILIWIITVFLIAIVVLGAQLELKSDVFKSFIPLAFFSLLLLITWKLERYKLVNQKYLNRMELTLYLSYYHKFIDKIIVFSLPTLLILIALIRGGVMIYDLVQASTILIVLYIWHTIKFKKV